MKLADHQIVTLAEELLLNQGNSYETARKLFGEYPSYDEIDFSNLILNVGKIFSCIECETWYLVEKGNKHPVYTGAGICICKLCLCLDLIKNNVINNPLKSIK